MEDDVIKNLEKLINTLDGSLVSELEKILQSIENTAKSSGYCPVDDGPLRADIQHEIIKGDIEGKVGNTLEYAPYVHQGTGIYAVDGDGRKEVPWTYKGADGKYHSTSGQKPNDYLQRAIDANKGIILKTFGEGVSLIWKK